MRFILLVLAFCGLISAAHGQSYPSPIFAGMSLSGTSGTLVYGTQTAVKGTTMRQDWLQSAGANASSSTAGYFPNGSTYCFACFAQTITTSSVSQDGEAPNATIGAFAYGTTSNKDVMPLFAMSVGKVSNAQVWGFNFISTDDGVHTNVRYVGGEIDLQPSAGATVDANSTGLIINGFNGTFGSAINIGTAGGSGKWTNGVTMVNVSGSYFSVGSGNTVAPTSFINTVAATTSGHDFSASAIVLGASANQNIAFGGGGSGVSPRAWGDGSNNLIFQAGSSNFIELLNSAGGQQVLYNNGSWSIPTGSSYQINNSTVLSSTLLKLTPITIATLPTCNSAAAGSVVFVSDTLALAAPTFHSTVTGGGATTVNSLASCNGTLWQYN